MYYFYSNIRMDNYPLYSLSDALPPGCQILSICSNAFILSSNQSFNHVQLFAATWTVACQASLSITNSQSLLRLMSIKLVMPSKYLIFCHPLLLLSAILPSIRVFSVIHIRWPKYWSFSFSISPSNEYSRLISLGLQGDETSQS